MLTVTRYGRFWAVYRAGELLAVTVYKKGARAVVAALQTASHHASQSAAH